MAASDWRTVTSRSCSPCPSRCGRWRSFSQPERADELPLPGLHERTGRAGHRGGHPGLRGSVGDLRRRRPVPPACLGPHLPGGRLPALLGQQGSRPRLHRLSRGLRGRLRHLDSRHRFRRSPLHDAGTVLPIDALFESMSGFTTTGASVLTDYDRASRHHVLEEPHPLVRRDGHRRASSWPFSPPLAAAPSACSRPKLRGPSRSGSPLASRIRPSTCGSSTWA